AAFQGSFAQVAEKANAHEREVATQEEIVLAVRVQQSGVKTGQRTSAAEPVSKHRHPNASELLGRTEHGNRPAKRLQQVNLTLDHRLMANRQMRLRAGHTLARAARQDKPGNLRVPLPHAAQWYRKAGRLSAGSRQPSSPLSYTLFPLPGIHSIPP